MTTPRQEVDLAALKRGQREAREALYFAYREPVSRFCLRRLGDPDAAGELVHDVFIAAFEGVGRFEGRSSLQTWLMGIALNLCRKKFREWSRRPQPLARAPAPQSAAPGPLRQAAQQDELSRIRDALSQLPRKQHEVLSLRVDGELSYQEIVELTGYGMSDVKVTIHRARQALKQSLRREGDPHGGR